MTISLQSPLSPVRQQLIERSREDSPVWMDVRQPHEAAWVETNGGALFAAGERRAEYYVMPAATHAAVQSAAEELHRMFMQATETVLASDALLARFGIPERLWARVRDSWNTGAASIAGRLDLAVDEKGIKTFEYNADSASCLMECGLVQGRWAEAAGCAVGFDCGAGLQQQLVNAWKRSAISEQVHLLHDADPEETYHALYMKRAMEEAGISCKTVVGLEGLRWGENEQVLDPDGKPIRVIWKTWAWETVLEQIRETPERSAHEAGEPVRLADLLLNPGIQVIEPMWTMIPSNKAILPVLWSLFPHHPNLLRAEYELSPALIDSGYASKPISGRCGGNITLYEAGQTVIEERSGRWADRDMVYQELWRLPRFGNKYMQIGCVMVKGGYGGSVIRADTTQIISLGSPVYCLRVVHEEIH